MNFTPMLAPGMNNLDGDEVSGMLDGMAPTGRLDEPLNIFESSLSTGVGRALSFQ